MNSEELDDLARHFDAFVISDGTGFRRAARTLQSIWRVNKGYPAGDHNGRTLGSRLPVDFAMESLANYLTPTIREVVRTELSSTSEDGRLFATPRIYNDLLSSQPLCFNLFGELKADLELATGLFQSLRPTAVEKVTAVRFEYSPGRSDQRFSGDRSAFDVFIEYDHQRGGRGFFGIEVKYHEDLAGKAAKHRPRYDEIAATMGCFRPESLSRLQQAPLQQIWRDHLLAGITKEALCYREGVFVFLYPAGNAHCESAIRVYRDTLETTDTFEVWTLELVLKTLKECVGAPWVDAVHERYLDFSVLKHAATRAIP